MAITFSFPRGLAAVGTLALLAFTPAARADVGITETNVQIQVDGAVRKPGVYAVRRGGRVAEAIAAAGGPLPGARLLTLNLARAVVDGERCHVPAAGEALPAPASSARPRAKRARKAAAKPPTPDRPVDLNRATLQDLDTLPGVGPATAARILAVRKRLGRFRNVEELREVPGIGAKRLARLRPLVEAR